MAHIPVDPAPWIEDLPRNERGFVVPAEAGWHEGRAILSKVATDRKVALGMRRGCGVCGYPLAEGKPVYRAFAQGDAAQMRGYERERSHDSSGPLHLSCVLYSAMVCPYLREKNARLSKTSEINPGGRRGGLAAVMGFEDYGLMVYPGQHRLLDAAFPVPAFAYLTLCEDIPYREGVELADRYAAAVVEDEVLIDTSRPRLYWTDQPTDLAKLQGALRADTKRLNRAEPDYEQHVIGEGRYVVYTQVISAANA